MIRRLLTGVLKLVLALVFFAFTGQWPSFARWGQLVGSEPAQGRARAEPPTRADRSRPPASSGQRDQGAAPPMRTWSRDQPPQPRPDEAYDDEGEDYEHEGEAYDYEEEDYEHEGEAYDHEGEHYASAGEHAVHAPLQAAPAWGARAPRESIVARAEKRSVKNPAPLKAAFRDRRTLRDAVMLSALLAQRAPRRR